MQGNHKWIDKKTFTGFCVSMKILKFLPPLFPFFLYLFTCAPGIGLGDTALLIDQIMQLTINSHVNNHNLTILFGNLFSKLPFTEIAYRTNLLSVFFGGAAVALFYFLVLETFQSIVVASVSASILAVSNSMWWHSTMIESYAINAIFTVGALYLILQLNKTEDIKFLYGLFFIAGLSIFNHTQMGIVAVGAAAYLVFHLAVRVKNHSYREAGKVFGLSSLFFVIGFSLFLGVFLRDVMRSGNFQATFKTALGGDFQSIMFKGTFVRAFFDLIYLILKQFPSPFILAVFYGAVLLVRNWKIKPLLALGAMFLLNTIFFMYYNTWDKFAFLLPSFIVLAYLGSFGINRAVEKLRDWNSLVLYLSAGVLFLVSLISPIYLYSNLSKWGSTYWFWSARYNNNYTINTHDCAGYIANPNKRNYRDVEEYSNLIFQKLPANSIYIDDDSRVFYPINHYFQKYYNKRQDIKTFIINSWGFSSWGLDKNAFSEQLDKAFLQNQELFLVSLDFPFNDFLNTAFQKRKYRFERYYLNSGRYVYRMQNSKDVAEKKINLSEPGIKDLKTGVFFQSNFPIVKSVFEADDPVMASVEFFRNETPFQINFEWSSPDSKVFFESEAFEVATGNTRVWNRIKEVSLLEKGKWKVAVKINGKRSIETEFNIE